MGENSIQYSFASLGTTLIDLPRLVYTAVAKALFGLCATQRIKGLCYQSGRKGALPEASSILSKCTQLDSLQGFPTLGFEIGGERFDVEPASYVLGGATMCPHSPPGHYRLGLERGEDLVLGMVFMANKLSVFDRANRQVGFADLAPAACARSILV